MPEEQIVGDELWPDDISLNGSYTIAAEKQKHREDVTGTGRYALGSQIACRSVKRTWTASRSATKPTPTGVMQGSNSLDHSPYGFSVWIAGSGVRGGQAIGATDELGFRAVENTVHIHDLHAAMRAAMELDHEQLTYHFEGRPRRLTDVFGRVVKDALG